jgi:CspA family cold shock protein
MPAADVEHDRRTSAFDDRRLPFWGPGANQTTTSFRLTTRRLPGRTRDRADNEKARGDRPGRQGLSKGNTMSKTGTVKFFNADKGYGFIQPDDGSADSFVHISAVQAAGMQTLNKDQRLNYEVETGRNGKASAVNLSAAD